MEKIQRSKRVENGLLLIDNRGGGMALLRTQEGFCVKIAQLAAGTWLQRQLKSLEKEGRDWFCEWSNMATKTPSKNRGVGKLACGLLESQGSRSFGPAASTAVAETG